MNLRKIFKPKNKPKHRSLDSVRRKKQTTESSVKELKLSVKELKEVEELLKDLH
jgi:hypothetical protein